MATNCTWESFIPDILPFVSSPEEDFRRAPDKLIMHTVKQAALEFLKSSQLMRDNYCLDLQCGVTEVPLEIPEDQELIAVNKLTIQGVQSKDFDYDDDETITLHTPPYDDVRNGYCVTYSYIPAAMGDCDVPSILCSTKWRRAVRDYALRDLFGMENMDWSDKAYHARYETISAKHAANAKRFAARKGVTKRKRLSKAAVNTFWD